MVAWNLIFAAALISVNQAGFDSNSYDRMLETGPLNSIFAIWKAPINGPLYFLRDMFVISIFAPILVRAIRSAPLILLTAAGLLVWFGLGEPVIFRPITLFCFCVGLGLRIYGSNLRALDAKLIPILLFSCVFWIGGTWFVFATGVVENMFDARGWFDMVNRLVVIVVFWVLGAWIATTSAVPIFEWMEKFIYLVFLSHSVVILFIGGAFKVSLVAMRIIGT